jgi:tRNA nucleotidyltransferase (CCA-adding enzyme)
MSRMSRARQVILTHEHADFDAVASLVGLARLLPGAVPVRPDAVNANVEQFLTLFGRQLPLQRREDLPRTPVTHAWMVDSRKVQPVKGMSAHTPRSLIDHHLPVEEDPGAFVSLDVQAVGATATLITERLRAAGATLPVVESTLLLLGIYEDTGALTYGGTTPRDLRAAAWLLEAGAALDALGQFLARPLSAAAQAVLRRLMDEAESLEQADHRVVIATAAAPGYQEEVSMLATKMLDLLAPAALFVLVDVGTHVQLVARSTTDDVDVAAVAEALGGGGHTRAAAALLRDLDLAAARAAVLERLPGAVRPAARVASIMSRGPVRSLRPDQTVDEALHYARMVGHEGFPVMEGDRVLGVVTRRELDRAAHHNLAGAPLRQLLAGPPPLVSPADGIQTVQRLMVEHDLGQVPVIEEGRVVGIVTRTDLLKLWAARDRPGSPPAVRVDLGAALAPAALAAIRQVAETAAERGDRAYLVGGLPRDLLLGVPPGADIDLVIEGDAEALARAVAARHGGRVTAHRHFGTSKWLADGVAIDLVSARAEFYRAPTALPTVERGSLQSDLRRRDFTINTLAVDLDPNRFGEVVDLFNGLADLTAGRVRVLHSLSFVEDPTRILRAARFEARLGFRIEPRTGELAQEATGLLKRVSGARLRNELLQLFAEREPAAALERLEELGALGTIEPGLGSGRRTRRLLEVLPAAWSLWRRLGAAGRLEAAPEPRQRLLLWLSEHGATGLRAAERLRLTRRSIRELQAILELLAPPAALRDPAAANSTVFHALASYQPAELCLAWLGLTEAAARRHLLHYGTALADVRPVTTGADLAALGLPPGPDYGRLLGTLLDARLDGRVSSPEEELALVGQLLAAGNGAPPADDG